METIPRNIQHTKTESWRNRRSIIIVVAPFLPELWFLSPSMRVSDKHLSSKYPKLIPDISAARWSLKSSLPLLMIIPSFQVYRPKPLKSSLTPIFPSYFSFTQHTFKSSTNLSMTPSEYVQNHITSQNIKISTRISLFLITITSPLQQLPTWCPSTPPCYAELIQY